MTSVLNLMYFPYEDTFYYIDVADIDPVYRDDFLQFIQDVIDSVNIPNPVKNIGLELDSSNTVQEVEIGDIGDSLGFYTKETGDGVFPFSHSIQLANIPSSQINTGYAPDAVYNYDIEIQSQRYQFSALGAELVTYSDVVALIENNSPAIATYYSVTESNTHYINISSNVAAASTGTAVIATASQVAINTFSNESYSIEETVYDDTEYASYDLTLPRPTAANILTLAPSDDTIVFVFSVGPNKNLGVKASQAQTYQDLIDTINLYDDINATYDNIKNTLYLYVPIPKTPTIDAVTSSMSETDPDVITANALLRSALTEYSGIEKSLQIEDISGLAAYGSVLHILKNSIYGGYNMLSVLQNSKRSNGSYWTEIAAIKNDKKSNNDIVSNIPEQALIVDAIQEDETASNEEKRNIALDLNNINRIDGPLNNGIAAAKGVVAADAVSKIPTIVDVNYLNQPSTPTPPDQVATIQDTVVDNGFADGALSSTGEVLDENKLTQAQKSKLVPTPITTIP